MTIAVVAGVGVATDFANAVEQYDNAGQVCLSGTRLREIATEEVFGPVLVLHTFRTEDEAVALANDSEFGLAAMVCTGAEARAAWVSERLVAGTGSFDFYCDVKNTVSNDTAFAPGGS